MYAARCLSFLLALLCSSACLARDGLLDQSFMYYGWAQFDEFINGDRARFQSLRDAKFDSQGRVIAIGNLTHPGSNANADCLLVISTPGGRDLEIQQRLTLDRGGSNVELCASLEVLPDDRLVAVGYATTTNDRLTGIVVRLNADATPDTSFFDNGVFEVNAHIGWIDAAEATLLIDSVLDAQGRLLVVGRVQANGMARGLLLRFLADGTLDTGFGFDGAVPLADFSTPLVQPTSLALDAQGRILVGGTTQQPGSVRHGVIFRVLDDGSLDTSYGAGMNGANGNGGGGRGFVSRCDRIASLAVDGSGRTLMGCEPDVSGATPGPLLAAGVLRLGVNGQPDTSFGGDGLVEPLGFTSPMGTLYSLPRIALQADGKIVMAATLDVADQSGNEFDWYVTRLNANGTVDTGFGYQSGYSRLRVGDPYATSSSDSYWESVSNLVLDPRGRPVIVGQRDFGTQATRFLIARLGMADPAVASGYLDPEFGFNDGYRLQRFDEFVGGGPRQDTTGTDVAVDSSGRITTIGRLRFDTNPSPTYQCVVTRSLADGRADTSFAPPNGRRSLSLSPTGANVSLCTSVLALDDGSTLIAGSVGNSGTVIRLLPDGSVDTSFFGNGVLETWTDLNFQATSRSATFNAIMRDTQGRIVIAGSTAQPGVGGTDQFGVVLRLTAGLAVDTSFGDGGVARLHTTTNPFRLYIESIAQDADGNLYFAGSEGQSFTAQEGGVVHRLLDDGSVDTSWPGDSNYVHLVGVCLASGDIALDAQQRPMVSCYRSGGGVGILRLLRNGELDLNFGTGGITPVNFIPPSQSTQGRTTSVQQILSLPDGKLVAVGTHMNTNGTEVFYGTQDIGVTRLLENGSPDPDFGGANSASLFRLPEIFGRYDEFANAAVLQPDGRVLVIGTQSDRRPGVPVDDATRHLLMRVSNVVPVVENDVLFANGFEG
jgi:uncharacterized delta-60 repeat protein